MTDAFNTGTDVLEDELLQLDPALLDWLLCDHTTGRNIIWATDDYYNKDDDNAQLFQADCPILPELVTGKYGTLIVPRSKKSKKQQQERVTDKGEIFTPSWMCNYQNNLIDKEFFGRKNVFNLSKRAAIEGGRIRPNRWKVTKQQQAPIQFPYGKSWKDYVCLLRLEITCGEAPYLVGRYDAESGRLDTKLIHRAGLLDRKLRVVGENTITREEWHLWAVKAFQSVYGYEYQGDSLLIARENLFCTYVDYFKAKFPDQNPTLDEMRQIAEVISWNIWQMDGLTFGIPGQRVLERMNNAESQGSIIFADDSETAVLPEQRLCRIMEWTNASPLEGNEIIVKEMTL